MHMDEPVPFMQPLRIDMHVIKAKEVTDALKDCVDPELGIGIVDMGLIYRLNVTETNDIKMEMTMTSPMCPVTSVILADAHLRLEKIPDVGKVDIDLVWEPAWNPEMMSEEVRMSL